MGYPKIKTLADLVDKTIAGAPSHLEKLKAFLELDNRIQATATIDHIKAFDPLKRGRVNVVIAYEFDRTRSEYLSSSDRHRFNNDFIIDTTSEVVACLASAATRAFIETLNAAIAVWQADDKLDALFGRKKD